MTFIADVYYHDETQELFQKLSTVVVNIKVDFI